MRFKSQDCLTDGANSGDEKKDREYLHSSLPLILESLNDKTNSLTNGNADEKAKALQEDPPPKTRRQQLRAFFKTFVVEPFMYSFIFSLQLRSVTHQNFILDKACLVDLHYPEDVCTNIHAPENMDAKNSVQKLGNDLHMYCMIIAIVPSALCTIVLGPWSDKYSRKYPIVFATVGMLLDMIILMVLTAEFHTPATYVLIAQVPAGLGGIMVVITCIYSYLSELTTEETRTFRFAVLDLGFLFAGPVGTALGGIIFKYYGYMAVFVTSFVAQLLGLIFLMVRMEDSKHENLKNNYRQALKDIFSLENIKDSIRTCVKKREGNARKEIWLQFLSMCAIIVSFLGTMSVGYLFAQKMYNWSVTKYSIVHTLIIVSHGIAVLLFIPFFTKLVKMHDSVMILLGASGMAAHNIVKGFANVEWLYYVAAALGILSGIAGIGIRSRLSKIVAKEEQGKVFSVLALTESLTPVIGVVVFAQIYNATITFFPGLVFEVAAIFLTVPIVVSIWIYKTSAKKEREDFKIETITLDETKMEHVL